MGRRIAIFQHAEGEVAGAVAKWLEVRAAELDVVRWWENPFVAEERAQDWEGAVILGGAMNIYQHRDYPWLVVEKRLLDGLLEKRAPLLGICLGGQLLADRLGARVTQNPEIEIGWWPVRFTEEARAWAPSLPEEVTLLHWHGDTFELPKGAMRLASSEACAEQGFFWGGHVLGLQFHPEVISEMMEGFCGCADGGEWPTGRWVQSRSRLVEETPRHEAGASVVLDALLERLFGPMVSGCGTL